MHAAKVKVMDMASTAKEKLREGSAKAEEKAEKATAHTQMEREIAHERAKAKEAEAKAELHQEKAEHRAYGIARVPLTGHHHHHRPIGSGPASGTVDPTYPTAGTRPAGEKYL